MKNAPLPQNFRALRPWLALAVTSLCLLLAPPRALPQTWLATPGSDDWTVGSNWTGGAVPGSTGTATFGTSNTTSISVLGGGNSTFSIGGILFNAGASPFTITVNPTNILQIDGVGIANNSGFTQEFVTAANDVGYAGSIQFTNSATAGTDTLFTNTGATVTGGTAGYTSFAGYSTAGSATFVNDAGALGGAPGGEVQFSGTSTAGTATFTNQSGLVSGAGAGSITFAGSATAGAATFTNYGSTVDGAGVGNIQFSGSSTAGTATFINNGGGANNANGGDVAFNGSSSVGGATFTNYGGTANNANGGDVVFNGYVPQSNEDTHVFLEVVSGTFTNDAGTVNGAQGGYVQFLDNVSAGTATIINNGGAANGSGAGFTIFQYGATSGTATIIDNGATGLGGGEGNVAFESFSDAGKATFTNNPGTVSGAFGGCVTFDLVTPYTDGENISVAGAATFIDNGGTVTGQDGASGGGYVEFGGYSSADHATFANYGSYVNDSDGVTPTDYGGALSGSSGAAFVEFYSNSTAGNAAFTNFGGTVSAASGGYVIFHDGSTANNATFLNTSGTNNGVPGEVVFLDNSTSDGATFTNQGAGSNSGYYGGVVFFYNTTTSGTATFANGGGTVSGALGGTVIFSDTSSAGAANFTNYGGTVSGALGGAVIFSDSSTADNATFTNYGSATSGTGGGTVIFQDTTTAGTANFTNDGGTAAGALGGSVQFVDSSTASDGTFTNNGGTTTGALGGTTVFNAGTMAGNATLIANAGTNGGGGGGILFESNASGGLAAVELNGSNSYLDISYNSGLGVSIGSLEGTGQVFLGSYDLTVGVNNANTDFSGVIQDGGQGGVEPGVGGSLIKVGNGTLELDGDNTYSGYTIVETGTLTVGNGGTLGNGAALNVYTPGTVDISQNGYVPVVVGSLEGGGNVFLGNDNLTVGGNNNSTIYSGALLSGGLEFSPENGGGSLTKLGSGILTLTGTNNYGGPLFLKDGTVAVANDGVTAFGQLGVNDVYIYPNGNLDISQSVPGATVGFLAGSGNVFLGSRNLTISGSATAMGFSGVIQDGGLGGGMGGSLSLYGDDGYNPSGNTVPTTLNILGPNTYTGSTTINSYGVISVVNDGSTTFGSLGTGSVNVYPLGTLELNSIHGPSSTAAAAGITQNVNVYSEAGVQVLGGSAGGANTIYNVGGGGYVEFIGASETAGAATFNVQDGGAVAFYGWTNYGDGITYAGSGIFNNYAGGTIYFSDDSNADGGTFNTFGSASAGQSGGLTQLTGYSNAGGGVFTNYAGNAGGASGGLTSFNDNADAGYATITNKGAGVDGASGGQTVFAQETSADGATLIACSGSNGGLGGSILFEDHSTGGTLGGIISGGAGATVKVYGNGYLDISGETSPTSATPTVVIGALEGTGNVFLGSNNLTIDDDYYDGGDPYTDSGNSTFSGNIQDGSAFGGGGTGGSLTLNGHGTLVLTGTNTYTGTTTVSTNYGSSSAGTILQFGKESALYDDNHAYWTTDYITVNANATLALNVGGPGEFTSADIALISTLGNFGGGFQPWSILGLDTTNAPGGNFTYAGSIYDVDGPDIPGEGVPLGLSKLGTGTLTLTGSDFYSGPTLVAEGSLVVDNNGGQVFGYGSLGNDSAVSVNQGATLQFVHSASAGNDQMFIAGALIFSGSSTGGSSQLETSGGSIVFQDNSTGGTATVILGYTPDFLDISGETPSTPGATPSVALAELAGSGNVFLGSNNLTVGSDNGDGGFSGVIQDGNPAGGGGTGGSFTKVGTGTFTLTGANTYTGTTTVAAGTLAVDYYVPYGYLGSLGGGPVIVDGGTVPYYLNQVPGGIIKFLDYASAGTGPFTIYGSSVASALGGSAQFKDYSTAGTAIITNYGGSVDGGSGGYTQFNDSSTAGGAAITAEGSTVGGAQPGYILFTDESTADNATLIATAGMGGNAGGNIIFQGNSTGGAGVVMKIYGDGNYTNAFLDISQDSNPIFTIGSLEGNGDVYLGSSNLTLGGNDNSTTFSGAIQDGSAYGGSQTGASLTKVGSGSFTLAGQNTYTGATTLDAGIVNLGSPENPGVSGPLGDSGPIVFGGGILQYSANNQYDYSGRFSTADNQPIAIDTNGQTVTFATALVGNLSTLTLTDSDLASPGTLILTAANTYTGTTTIDGGTLDIGGGGPTGSISSSSPLVLGGGTLSYTDTGDTTQTFAGTTLTPGQSVIYVAGGDTVELGDLTQEPGGTFDFEGTGTLMDAVNVSGPNNVLVSAAGTAFATVGGVDWAVENGGVITALSASGSYADDYNADDIDVGSSAAYATDYPDYDVTVNTLRFNAYALTLQLSGVNTVSTGGILVTPAGISDSMTGGSIQSGVGQELVVIDNGSLNISSSIADSASGPSALTLSGAGTTTLSGQNTYTGVTNLNGGIVNLGSPENVGTSGPLGDSAYINPGSIVFNGGTLQYSASNNSDYSGRFSIAANQFIVIDTNGQTVIFATPLASPGGTLTLDDSSYGSPGTLILAAANTYTGVTTLNAGTLNLGGPETPGVSGPLGDSPADNPGSIVFGGGVLQYSASNQNDYSGRFSTADGQPISIDTNGQTVTFATALTSNNGSLTLTDSDLESPGVLILAAANTYTGPTTVNAGTLAVANDGITAFGTLGSDSTQVYLYGNLDISLSVVGAGIGSLQGTGTVFLGGNDLRVGYNNYITTFYGVIRDGGIGGGYDGSLTKVDYGTLTLAGASTYTGATTVTAGTLIVTGSLNGTSYTTVTNATLAGSGYIANYVTIGNEFDAPDSAILVPGAVGVTGKLTIGGPLALDSDAEFVFNLDSSAGGAGNGASELLAASMNLDAASQFMFTDIAATPGALTPGMEFTAIQTTGGITGTFENLANDSLFTSGPNTYEATYSSTELTLTVVPEPATWGMMVSGLGMFIGIRKLRKRPMRA